MLKFNLSTRTVLAVLFLVAIAAGLYALNVSHLGGGLDALPLMFGMAAGAPLAPAANRPNVPYGRSREPMKPFFNVAVSSIAVSVIPRYPRTILGMILQLGGTTFTKADISRIELFCGEKSIWGPVSGTELDDFNEYVSGSADQDAFMLPLDFTCPNVKEIGGEQIGGIDLMQLDDGVVRMEVEIGSGATAPQLVGHIVWGAPQGSSDLAGLMKKLVKRVYPQFASGDQFPAVDLKGAIVLRQAFRYTVGNAAVTAASGSGAAFANTGNGVLGAVTVSQGTPTGRYRLRIIEPAANLGTFAVYDPNGREIGGGVVGTAFSGGGLAFTLADGATDFVAGDGFTIDVLPMNTDGNLNSVEIKKNDSVWWSRSCRAARYESRRYGRTPQHRMYVADFLLDNHSDSVMDTADAVSLDYKINLTAADTITVIHEILARPIA